MGSILFKIFRLVFKARNNTSIKGASSPIIALCTLQSQPASGFLLIKIPPGQTAAGLS